jgi:hypothetical protein
MKGDGHIDVFTIQNFTQWLSSSGGMGSWEVLNNGQLPADEALAVELSSSDGLIDPEDDTPLPPTNYRPDATADWCSKSGWHHRIISWKRTFKAVQPFSWINKTNMPGTFNFQADKTYTETFTAGSSISGTVKAGILAELSGTISSEISASQSVGTQFGGSISVPPGREVTAKLGFRRVRAVVESYYLMPTTCAKTQVRTNTVVAPWRPAWQVTSRRV